MTPTTFALSFNKWTVWISLSLPIEFPLYIYSILYYFIYYIQSPPIINIDTMYSRDSTESPDSIMFVSSNICNVTVRLVAAGRVRRFGLAATGRSAVWSSGTVIARSAEPFIVDERTDATVRARGDAVHHAMRPIRRNASLTTDDKRGVGRKPSSLLSTRGVAVNVWRDASGKKNYPRKNSNLNDCNNLMIIYRW